MPPQTTTLPFPQTQAQMKQYREDPNIVFKGGEWTRKTAEPVALEEIEKGIQAVQEQIPQITAGVQGLTAEIDATLAPAVGNGAGDITATTTGVIAGVQEVSAEVQQKIDASTKRAEEAAKRADEALKGVFGILKKKEELPPLDTKQLTIDVLAQYGYTPESVTKVQGWMGQLTTYNQQVADLEARKQARLDVISERPGLGVGFMTREQNRVSKEFNREISAKAAQAGIVAQQIQMERGLWSDARATTNMIVQAATYDQRQQLADLDWVMDTYMDLFNIMSKEEQTAWNRAYTLTKDELDRQQTDIAAKNKLVIDAAQKNVNLGWTMQDLQTRSIEELTAEYAERIAAIPEEVDILSVAEAKSLGVPFGTTKEQAFGITPRAARGVSEFTTTQKLKLEQAGLSVAPRQQQLDFLFAEETPISKGEYKKIYEQEEQQTIHPDVIDQSYQEYLLEFDQPEFTASQKLRLEQAGLLNAPRQQQLNLLFTGGVENPFRPPVR